MKDKTLGMAAILIVRHINTSEYPAQKREPKGERREHWAMFCDNSVNTLALLGKPYQTYSRAQLRRVRH